MSTLPPSRAREDPVGQSHTLHGRQASALAESNMSMRVVSREWFSKASKIVYSVPSHSYDR